MNLSNSECDFKKPVIFFLHRCQFTLRGRLSAGQISFFLLAVAVSAAFLQRKERKEAEK